MLGIFATPTLASAVPSSWIMLPRGLLWPESWPGLAPQGQTSREPRHPIAPETDPVGMLPPAGMSATTWPQPLGRQSWG